jgi:hypothetical protein
LIRPTARQEVGRQPQGPRQVAGRNDRALYRIPANQGLEAHEASEVSTPVL